MVFYLTLRALDTVEDDTGVDAEIRSKELKAFAKKIGNSKVDYSLTNYGKADEKTLVEQMPKLQRVLHSIIAPHREVVLDIAQKMGDGMASYVHRDFTQGTKDNAEYDLYCHYVAGLVGEGLTALFKASNCINPAMKDPMQLSNSMGCFLQKTNIIRDYLEDFVEGRAFWPRQIWGDYGDDLGK
jgi:farnesyl-diphosphate farnesyltransferase